MKCLPQGGMQARTVEREEALLSRKAWKCPPEAPLEDGLLGQMVSFEGAEPGLPQPTCRRGQACSIPPVGGARPAVFH